MAVFLKGLALRNYRGIGPDIQRMAGFKDFNFFIGANNVGKSAVLRFISTYLPLEAQSRSERRDIATLERHRGSGRGEMRVEFGFSIEDFCKSIFSVAPQMEAVEEELSSIAVALTENGYVWGGCNDPFEADIGADLGDKFDAVRHALDDNSWYGVWARLTGSRGGDIEVHWIPEVLLRIFAAQEYEIPCTRLIPAIRQIGPKSELFSDFSGKGLIDRLAQLQNPDLDKRQEYEDFKQINAFVQNVTGCSDAQIEIPHNRDHVLVHMGGKILPLSSLGSGIEEVVLLAACCTISKKQIVCIEEPELHLHPILQRKLTAYLQRHTDNQYFIATHSPTFIDTPDAAIFHVYQEGGSTKIKSANLRSEKQRICSDLGHRASALLQSNAVIWVEGPSDRIYLRRWLQQVAPELEEGLHFSIMFYGGRLLSHLTAEDDEVTDFINLRALNRNTAVLIDSDKKNEKDEINATKHRIAKEFNAGGGVAWVTAGREIENYIDHAVLQSAVKSVYENRYSAPIGGGRFQHALHFKRADNGKTQDDIDKVKVARKVCEETLKLDVLDLQERLRELVDLIWRANR